jgi:hypothetical protein
MFPVDDSIPYDDMPSTVLPTAGFVETPMHFGFWVLDFGFARRTARRFWIQIVGRSLGVKQTATKSGLSRPRRGTDPKSQIPNPNRKPNLKSQISNLKSQISNLKSQISNPNRKPNPKSQIQPPGPHANPKSKI